MPRKNHDGTYIYSPEEHAYSQVADKQKQFTDDIFARFNDDARALVEKAHPNMDQGTYTSEKRLRAEIEKLRKERDDEKLSAKEQAERDKWAKEKDGVQKQYGFTDDGMKKLEELMVAENIGSYKAAAAYMATIDPKPTEATMGAHYWNHDKQDGFKEIAADPEKWGHEQLLRAAMQEQQRAKNRSF